MQISELMIPEFEREAAMTRKLLARVPSDKLGWKPAEGLKTIGWNTQHLAEIAGWVPVIVGQDELDLAPPGGPAYAPPPPATDVAQILKTFDENVPKSVATLRGVPDSVMDQPWTMKMGGHPLFTMKKGDCLRKWIFAHTAHHRGILSVYLKMAGVKIGSIYEE